MGLPQQDVLTALRQLPSADVQPLITEVTKTAAPATTDASQPSSGSNWVTWGAASLVAGGGGLYAYKKFDLGTKLSGLDLGGKLSGLKSSIPDSLSGLAARFRPAAPGAAVVPDVVPTAAEDVVPKAATVVADAAVPEATTVATDSLAKVVAETGAPMAENLAGVAGDSLVPLAITGLKEAVEGGLSGTLGHAVEAGATDLLVTGGEKTALSVAADVVGDVAKVAEL
jgi:hypothetical protein